SKTDEGISLSQTHYVEKILEKFSKNDLKMANTPIDPSIHLMKNTGNAVKQLEYSRIIGSLMYLMNCTRPDIAYSVSKLSRFTSNPNNTHWNARVLRYLRKTKEYRLHYTTYPAVLEGYA